MRRRRRLWAVRGVSLVLPLAGLVLLVGGGGWGEELLSALLAAWRGRGIAGCGAGGCGRDAGQAGGSAGLGKAAMLGEGPWASGAGGVPEWDGVPRDQLLPPPPPCGPNPPFLLVLVPSAPSHAPQRQAIRDTWGGDPHPGGFPIRILFVLGVPPTAGEPEAAEATRDSLRTEWGRHRDLLQGPFRDTYANLTLKTLLLLRWARSRCPGAPFLLKADDDVFVNIPALASHLAPFRDLPLYLGRVHWWVRPARDPSSRHHVPRESFPGWFFPPYCSGTSYVLSSPALREVLEEAPGVPLLTPEDVWVGVCARKAGLTPRHSARMAGSSRYPPERCCYREVLFTSHGLRPEELRRVWGLVRGDGEGCWGWQKALGVLRCRLLAAGEWLWRG